MSKAKIIETALKFISMLITAELAVIEAVGLFGKLAKSQAYFKFFY